MFISVLQCSRFNGVLINISISQMKAAILCGNVRFDPEWIVMSMVVGFPKVLKVILPLCSMLSLENLIHGLSLFGG